MRVVASIFLLGISTLAAWSQSHELVNPRGQVTATVDLQRGRVVVVTREGTVFQYLRDSRYDSADGAFVAFIDSPRNRVLRLPASGDGPVFIANLAEPAPQFRRYRSSIRPRGIDPPIAKPWPPGPPAIAPLPGIPPQSTLLSSEIVMLPPLPPVEAVFTNSHNRTLQVAVLGLTSSIPPVSFRLEPGQSESIQLQRDNGSERIELFQAIDAWGNAFSRQSVTPIPPQSLYEVVVHEWAIQSIAIDRTGKSPSAIEDINFQGRGLGRFPLPAGPELVGGVFDVHRLALAAQNPGAVAPLVPKETPPGPPNGPLDRALRDALDTQRAAQGSR